MPTERSAEVALWVSDVSHHYELAVQVGADRNRLAAQIAQILPHAPDGVGTLADLLHLLVQPSSNIP